MPTPAQMPAPSSMPPVRQTNQHQSPDAERYFNEIQQIFRGDKFSVATEGQKKQMIGTHIFRYVTNMVTPEFSPKITGMIIDLPIADLNYSVSSLEQLVQKVRSAVSLLVDTQNLKKEQAEQLPMFQQAMY